VKNIALRLASPIALTCSPLSRFFICALFLAGAADCDLLACDMSSSEVVIGRNFEVFVANKGKPLEGVEVRISKSIEKPDFHVESVASGVSGANGLVSFKNIRKGRYYVTATHAGIDASMAYLVVKAKQSPSRIGIEWPGRDILEVRAIEGLFNARFFRDTGRGVVLDMAYKQEGPFSNQNLRLTRADSGQIVGSTTTDGHGRFAFTPVQPGLYILHVKEATTTKSRHDMDIEGDIFVQVNASASDSELPALQLNESDCGLDYKRVDSNARIMH
jgi:hypothetical protein